MISRDAEAKHLQSQLRSTLTSDRFVAGNLVMLNIEERLEKLTERHEALTLMAAENRQRDRRMGEIMESIARLLHVAEIHAQRI